MARSLISKQHVGIRRQLIESKQIAGGSPAAIEELKAGTYYIDLSRAKLLQIDEMAEELASAKGLIFDVRSYPRLSYGFLGYLTDKPLLSQIWNIPQIIYPDHENFAGFEKRQMDHTAAWAPIQRKKSSFSPGRGSYKLR